MPIFPGFGGCGTYRRAGSSDDEEIEIIVGKADK
jgi:hypothetical protein